MARYWVVKTDRNNTDFIWSELQAGRLRQGWGYRADQDLKVIQELREKGSPLNGHQKRCWRGNRRMLKSEPNSVSEGDVVLTPHVPKHGLWSLCRVAGQYRFEIAAEKEDFGHVLPVEIVSKERPVNPYEEAVSARLRQTMRNQSRMWNIDGLSSEVDELLKALERGVPSDTLAERLPAILEGLKDAAWNALVHHYHGSEFERPCVLLLNELYDDALVEHTGGRGEQGADAICTYKDPLGIQYRVAVQIKMWEWDANWTRPLEQIRQAYEAHEHITGGVILSTSERVTDGFEERRQALEEELHIPIRVILRQELLGLFIEKLPHLVVDESDAWDS